MGKSSSKTLNQIDPTQSSQLLDQSGNCKFYRNKAGKQFEKYQIQGGSDSDFQNKYDFRIKNPSPYLVNAYYAKPMHNAFGCTSRDVYEVVTQRIYKRLSQMNNLSHEQALNTIYRSLKGYQQIFVSSGILLVNENMIGLDRDNKIKVWLNSNFGVNNKESEPVSYSVLPQIQQECTLVDNIIELVNQKTVNSRQWVDYLQDKHSRGKLGFKEALQVTEKHGIKNQVVVDGSFGEKQDVDYWEANQPKSKLTLHQQIPQGTSVSNNVKAIQSSQVAQTLYTRNRFQQFPKNNNFQYPQSQHIHKHNSIQKGHNYYQQNRFQVPNSNINNNNIVASVPQQSNFNHISGIKQKIMRQDENSEIRNIRPSPISKMDNNQPIRSYSQPLQNFQNRVFSQPKVNFNNKINNTSRPNSKIQMNFHQNIQHVPRNYQQLAQKKQETIENNKTIAQNNQQISHNNQQLIQNNHQIAQKNRQISQTDQKLIHNNQQIYQNYGHSAHYLQARNHSIHPNHHQIQPSQRKLNQQTSLIHQNRRNNMPNQHQNNKNIGQQMNPFVVLGNAPPSKIQRFVSFSDKNQNTMPSNLNYPLPQHITAQTQITQKILVNSQFNNGQNVQVHPNNQQIAQIQNKNQNLSNQNKHSQNQDKNSYSSSDDREQNIDADKKYQNLYEQQQRKERLQQQQNYNQVKQSKDTYFANNGNHLTSIQSNNADNRPKTQEDKIRQITSQVIYLNENQTEKKQQQTNLAKQNSNYSNPAQNIQHQLMENNSHNRQFSHPPIIESLQKNGNRSELKKSAEKQQNYEAQQQYTSNNSHINSGYTQKVNTHAQNKSKLESSKLSVKSSADLKGMVSYKDLRQLLKSTRKKP